MPPQTPRRIATFFVASLPFFLEGCDVIEILIYLLTLLAYGPLGQPYIANSCPSVLICSSPYCLRAGENGSFESGREIQEEEGLDPIRPNVWRPGARSLVAEDRSCRGQYGLYLHQRDTLIRQAYQLIDYRDLIPAGMPNEPRRLRVGASFVFSSATATTDFKLTIFTFSGYEPQSFPERGNPHDYAAQATSIQTTRVTANPSVNWMPIQTAQMLPPEVDVILVLLEYELTGDATRAALYVDGVEILLDTGPYGPNANSDQATTPQDTPVVINVLRNDEDPDGLIDPSTLRVVTAPDHGTTLIDEAGLITYSPEAAYTGSDRFTYVFSDADGLNAGALVTIEVLPGNRPPIAVADTVTTAPGVALDIDVLANDTDPDGDPLTVVAFGTPANGATELINGGAAIRYTPNAGFTGTDTFAYIIADDNGAQSNEVEVTVLVQ